jgi:DNA-binding GntR family transcriptional regulator
MYTGKTDSAAAAVSGTPEEGAAVPPSGKAGETPAVQDWRLRLASPVGGASLGDAVYQSISAVLRRGQIPKGSRLVEGDLARAMAVSRTPVREALRRLENDGLVLPAAGRGYVVADLMADAEHVFLIRARLEGLAASLAAKQITVPELEGLRALQTGMEATLETQVPDLDQLVDLNYRFHAHITRAARSPRLEHLIDRLHPEYVSYQVVRSYDEQGRRQSVEEHQAILEALWNRDVELADRLIQAHFEHGKTVVLREIESGAGTKLADGGRRRASR